MKTTLVTLAFTALFSLGAVAVSNQSLAELTPCEHCEKGHKCDDKCKKDKKGTCKADANKKEGESATSSCCKKGKKSDKCGSKTEKKMKKEELKKS